MKIEELTFTDDQKAAMLRVTVDELPKALAEGAALIAKFTHPVGDGDSTPTTN